ncbi:MAG TPA: PH domain-containing protein, partial [Kofleriaceae bacterium]|nr:PH domain-containing protein [Kofleriaceae bacterium]
MSDGAARFRFRPGRPWTAGLAVLLGGGLLVSTLAAGGGWTAWVGGGAALLGALYFASPVWRMEVRVDQRGLEVVRGGARRLALPWDQVVRVTVSPAHRTAFVDGG